MWLKSYCFKNLLRSKDVYIKTKLLIRTLVFVNISVTKHKTEEKHFSYILKPFKIGAKDWGEVSDPFSVRRVSENVRVLHLGAVSKQNANFLHKEMCFFYFFLKLEYEYHEFFLMHITLVYIANFLAHNYFIALLNL